MKKLVLSFLSILTCGTVLALPVGNPANPKLYSNHLWFGDCQWDDSCSPCSSWWDAFGLRLGYYGDFVYQRSLQFGDVNTIPETSIATNAGLVVVNVCDWLDLFGNVGVSSFSSATRLPEEGLLLNLNFSSTLSYGGGGRLTLWNRDNFYLGVEGQYFYSKTELDSFEPYGSGFVTYFFSGDERNANYSEWQVGLACAYRFIDGANFSMVPYAGIQFAQVDWELTSVGTPSLLTFSLDAEEQQLVGWALGMTALIRDMIGVTVEGRWANEKALSVMGQLSF